MQAKKNWVLVYEMSRTTFEREKKLKVASRSQEAERKRNARNSGKRGQGGVGGGGGGGGGFVGGRGGGGVWGVVGGVRKGKKGIQEWAEKGGGSCNFGWIYWEEAFKAPTWQG